MGQARRWAGSACVMALMLAGLAGCYAMRPSSGAGQTTFQGQRVFDPASMIVPAGYIVEVVARDLTFPTGIAFDAQGRLHVVESGYSYGEVFSTPRLLRLDSPEGSPTVVATGDSSGPWTGVIFHEGNFYIADGNVRAAGRVLRIAPDGIIQELVTGLPSVGDHHTNGPVISPDGWLYFGQGTATNAAGTSVMLFVRARAGRRGLGSRHQTWWIDRHARERQGPFLAGRCGLRIKTRPGRSPVNFPFAIVARPLTKTCTMPSARSCGCS